jgi:hypothetical protein
MRHERRHGTSEPRSHGKGTDCSESADTALKLEYSASAVTLAGGTAAGSALQCQCRGSVPNRCCAMEPPIINATSPIAASSASAATATSTSVRARVSATEPSDALPSETGVPVPTIADAAALVAEANTLPPSVDRGADQPSDTKLYALRIVAQYCNQFRTAHIKLRTCPVANLWLLRRTVL